MTELATQLDAVTKERDELRAELGRLRGASPAGQLRADLRVGEARADSFFQQRVTLAQLFAADAGRGYVGRTIQVGGWIRTARQQGGAERPFAFVHLTDGSTPATLQIVVEAGRCDLKALTISSALRVVGEVVESRGRGQAVELRADRVELLGGCDAGEYPFAKKAHNMETLRERPHLRIRTALIGSVMRVRNVLARATHDFYQARGFHYLHAPCITAVDCEGAGEMFHVTTMVGAGRAVGDVPATPDGRLDFGRDFFGRPAMLSVSGQLNGEMYASALGNIYTFGPTFRAENSHTSRHLAEFWMIEPEMAFADLRDAIDLAEAYLKACLEAVLRDCAADLGALDRAAGLKLLPRLEAALRRPFARLSYTEAVERLVASGKAFETPVSWGVDLSSEHEKYLTEHITGGVTVVHDYPRAFKAFYMRANEDGRTVAAMDVLAPGIGEIIGGSQREERLDELEARMRTDGMDPEAYAPYLDLRRYGTVPHAGFGLGFERLCMYCTGVENIRDVVPFPRYPRHVD